jgi:branched-chain amino acid transport system ATP-binding protein
VNKDALLELIEVTATYGASQALYGVDLSIGQGEAVALLGRNGMGKTTTIRTICRMLPLRSGKIRFAGTDLGDLPSHAVARLGVGLVPEGRRCFAKLTTQENLVAAARNGAWDLDRIWELFPQLLERRDQPASTLSGGEQQMLAIGRALMTNPLLLILDEATEGLAPVIRQQIWEALRTLRAQTLSILLVDKNLRELLPITDRCVILERGKTAWSGPATALDREVQDRYLGV